MESILIIFTQIFIDFIRPQTHFHKCFFGTVNKPIGYYKYETGIAHIDAFNITSANDREMCNARCMINAECFATLFTNNNCSFFNISTFDITPGNQFTYSKWISCNTKKGYQPPDGRCEGLWVTYMDKSIKIISYPHLDKKFFVEEWLCWKLCLDNPLCGFINRDSESCSIIAKWPVLNIDIRHDKKSQLDIWTCIDGFKNKIQTDKIHIKPSFDKCTGIWDITSRNFTLPKDGAYGLNFQTQIINNCLEECNQHSECVTALFSVEYSFCILKDVQNSYYSLPSADMNFIEFTYRCLINDSEISHLTRNEKQYIKLGMKCYKIVNTSHLYIAKDECGKIPPIGNFVKCIENGLLGQQTWTITDSCLLSQIYWGFPEESVKINITDVMFTKRMKIYTGLQSYWLMYSFDNLYQVNYLECRHFDASMPIEKLQNKEIVLRTDWQALPPNGTLIRFRDKIVNFDITASHRPFHSCKTKAACMDILRTMQILLHEGGGNTPHFSDIPFNFMIDDSGHIYEVRGWNFQSASVSSYNYNTMSIAYIGWFKYHLLNQKVLNNIKKFIEYSVSNGFVEKDYKVFIHQDLAFNKVTRNLVISIKNIYRYRGFLPDNCKNITLLTILINFSIIVPSIFLAYILYLMFGYKTSCTNCQFLNHLDCKCEKIFPESTYTSISENPVESYIIYERPTIISSNSHMKFIKLIRLWFINKFLENMNCRCDGNNLKHFLNSFSHDKSKAVIYEAQIKKYPKENKISLIILCVKYDRNLDFFSNLVQNKRCICHYFRVEMFDVSKISFDIQVKQ